MEMRKISFPEAVLVEILARLPLRSIARFKSVCKTWKSLIESSYFRRHRNCSSSWSLMFRSNSIRPITEAISFHGCKTWDLPKSPATSLKPSLFLYHSSNGLVWIEVLVDRTENMGCNFKTFVGNPVLQQWVEIPRSPKSCSANCLLRATGLVTRVEEDGVVSSFKLVMTCQMFGPRDEGVYVYSSETGLWTFKPLVYYATSSPTVNHNGMLFMWERDPSGTGPGVLVAHDFYGPEDDDHCRVIPLPLPYNKDVRRCLTTSGGDVIYIELLDQTFKVWKLKNNNSDGECWQLSRGEINMASAEFDINCFPIGMNPFDSDIVYLWSRQHGCLVSVNLKTQEFIVHQESENWSSSKGCYRINTSDSKGYMERDRESSSVLMFSQFVLPQWMDPVPRPPN